ncbi:fibronectin type III domain-containing protein [Arenibacter algicola]|uniref:fibronectin type III domain-containing protein n=1 Tax=Arenibacter algicola TaxID=616991 RepID=UPI001C07B64B|nr:fibronectin type III domain-containing protein [Arenibacter algicola]MBU2907069.1 fibronectin type III domain-containing protein [Arenibacter algicola]
MLASAQSFPVQLIPQVTPPPPIYFSQYADASTTNSSLRLQIILNDLEINNREIRLKAYFQGNGISFQSNDVVVGSSPLFLEGGVPLVLTNAELAPYFRFENITGISPNVYGQAIPEGAYQFCYEVYDVLTGNRLSQKSCAISVVFQNEPPFLISPRNKTLVAENNPQNIVFQWTPRSINVSNVEYELSLVEIWDTQIDPQAAFLSSPPVFQTTTTSTTYVYGPSDPLLLSGKNYAWRIQAKAKQGAEEIGLFKNQGYSEIFSFSYAGACDLPLGIGHVVKGSTNANIFWDDFSTEVPEYTIRYRQKGNTNEWFLNKTTTNQTTLWDLKAGTTYEYQLQKKCVVTGSEWSMTEQFTTFLDDNEASVYQCGITPNFSLTNKEPLPKLSTGESFVAGDFPIHVLEISGSNGRFTGKGYVTIPYLNSIKVGVEFTNVMINTDKQMSEGTVVTVYDPNLASILDVDDVVETVENAVDAVGELVNSIGEALNLDINRDTKERVNQIVDAMVAKIKDEDLPEDLKKQVEEAAKQMKDAKERFDYAIDKGDTSAAQNAQSDFETAQVNLKSTKAHIDDYKDDIADLLKEALFQLYREGRDKNVYSTFTEVKTRISNDYTEDSKILVFDFEEAIDTYIPDIPNQNELNNAELDLGIYLFSKVLTTDDDELFNSFLNKSKQLDANFFQIIKESKENGESNQEIINFLKEELKLVFAKILIPDL